MARRVTLGAGAAFLLAMASPPAPAPARVLPNDNRTPSGTMRSDTLVLRLVVTRAEWYPEAADGPHVTVEAFGEEGVAPSIPGPLIRVRTGTPIRATVRNALPDSTAYVIGLGTHPIAPSDTLRLPPGASATVAFLAGAPGTYLYRAVVGKDPDGPPAERETANGAFVVDPEGGSAPDRIFVVNVWAQVVDSMHQRQTLGFNGKSWPYTERLSLTVGDSVRWRVINGSTRGHPLHLHGFYYRVDETGTGLSSRIVPAAQRRLSVTDQYVPWQTRMITWSPDRPGHWLFHCHLTVHVSPEARLGYSGDAEHENHSSNAAEHMAGLVLGIIVAPRPGESYARTGTPRRLDLFAQQGGPRGPMATTYSYVLQRGVNPPAPDSVPMPSSTLVLTRGEPTDIVVHNRSREATGIHWHGIELESFSDGVVGWSSQGTTLAPPIAPGDSFRARLTLPRAGTFMYHTHLNDIQQLTSGATGPLIVLEPGEIFDPGRDHVYMTTWGGRVPGVGVSQNLLVNGDAGTSPDLVLAAGLRHRFRLINIGVALNVRFQLRRDTTTVQWQARAEDGADLPAALRVMLPAAQLVAVGETCDFEWTPVDPGVYELSATMVRPPGFTAPLGPAQRWVQRLVVR
ncbi:MAG TPA: multicopper oxidase domain-containing protein [Gemmatimonadales bacterium]|nr:multicopper oxidase domain-containing protein [Gemmatimonadales bacterium]